MNTRLSLAATLLLPTLLHAQSPDPRVGLSAGFWDAGQAISNMTLLSATRPSPTFFDSTNVGGFRYASSDLAFSGKYVFQGSFYGIQVWDISSPTAPKLRLAFPCAGGQGDPTVYGSLLFMSVEMPDGRLDCGVQGVKDSVSAERFRGVRIFDISDMDRWKQVAAVQTCRGSHTHTLVTDPKDPEHVYIYNSGTSYVRSPSELAGCSALAPDKDPNTSLFLIDVIKVPLKRPQDAAIVASPRLFADAAGNPAGLWKGGRAGEGAQESAETDQCHDITAYPALGLAAGACSGNGLLIDISNPANPKRIDQVFDPNFAYWHSATFSNDGGKVIFTDEWGGGMGARCRASDRKEWGANAIFSIKDRKMTLEGYYKLPAAQGPTENCVAHNGSLIPVPGRDLMVQAWYQGGISVFDFTDPRNPREIAYFDRGPYSATRLMLGGHWSVYWHNGLIIGSEIGRGLDILELKASEHLSQNEIEAAKLVRFDTANLQDQQQLAWPAAFVVARAYLDQLVRDDGLRKAWADPVYRELARAEKLSGSAKQTALANLAGTLEADAKTAGEGTKVAALAKVVRELGR